MKVAIYVRVSTADKNQDTMTQILPLKEYCQRRGWQVFRIYEDVMSGAKESRPALNEMMNDAKKRFFDVVLVFRFDRFARSTKQLINSLELFNSLGIDFISYNENIDTSTPAGKMMFTLVSAFSEFERSIIAERVRAGLERAKAQGKKLGRKPSKEVNPEEVQKLRKQGLSVRAIADRLGIPKSTVALHCPKTPQNPSLQKP
jgi:DNA invertase Pin-like site-specific DNA recombinase